MTIEPICKRVAGLDVHKEIIVCSLLIEDISGPLHEEHRSFGTTLEDLTSLATWLSSLSIELVIMESTGIYWKSVYSALEKEQLNIKVVNARHVKQVAGRKTDKTDSQWLASLGRCGLLRGSFIPDCQLRELRLFTRYRVKLQRTIASEKNRLHKVLDAAGVRLGTVVTDISGVSAQQIIKGLIAGEDINTLLSYTRGQLKSKHSALRKVLEHPISSTHKFLLQSILSHIESMERQRADLDQGIRQAIKPYEETIHLLVTIPGIDEWSAITLVAEIGDDVQRFGSMDRLCSWSGMCPGNNESAGKRMSGRTRHGNSFLKTAICEIANAAVRTKSQFKAKYQSLVVRRGYKRTIVAIGHKIMRVIYTLLITGNPYKDPGIDYEGLVVKRNATRWMKALTRYGYTMEEKKTASRRAKGNPPSQPQTMPT